MSDRISRMLRKGDAFAAIRSVAQGANAAQRVIAVFNCYLDDSGTCDQPVVNMSGFLADFKNWDEVEPKLEDVCQRHGVGTLHAKEFHDTKGCFQGWSKIRKRTFADELFSASHGKLAGYSATIRRAAVIAQQKEKKQIQTMSPLGVCFSMILTQIMLSKEIGHIVKESGLSFLVETGNKNNPGIESLFSTLSQMPMFEGSLKSISFIPKNHCRAIQIADFFAFYSRRQMRNHDRFSGRFVLPACPYLTIINSHGPMLQMGAHGTADMVAKAEELTEFSQFRALASASTR